MQGMEFPAGSLTGNLSNRLFSEEEHSHEYCEILLMIEGTAVFKTKSNTFAMSRKHFCIIPPEAPHSVIMDSIEPPVIATLCFSRSAFDAVFSLMENERSIADILTVAPRQSFVLSENDFSDILPKVRSLQRKRNDPIYIMQILLHLLSSANEEKQFENHSSAIPKTLEQAIDSMHETENLCEGVPALVKKSGYSKSRLNALMRQYLGTTPHLYVTKLRMDKAKDLLLNSEATILSIALELGYATESHFISTFKKFYGITPSKMRSKR